MLSLLIFVPLAGVIALNLLFKIAMRRWAFRFTFLLFFMQLAIALFNRRYFYDITMDPASAFFSIKLFADSLTYLMLISIQIVCLASLVVAKYTLTDNSQRFNFINLLLLASIGMNGIVMARDIFSLYVFLEIVSVSSFVLIAFRRGRDALEGAFKYIMLSAVATTFMLIAIALLFFVSGDMDFAVIHNSIAGSPNSHIILLALGCFLTGLFIKSGLVPFHGWLPDAYSKAPSAVSILLAGIITKVCGVYILIRLVVSVFGPIAVINNIIMFFGIISILIGAFGALGQKEMKRLLAYSSISQVGYIILGLGCGTELAIAGAAMHMFNHAIFKTLLFVNAGAINKKLFTDNMDEMSGLSDKMPVTGITSVIGFLSAGGIPPLAGFWSKLIIIIALFQAKHYTYGYIATLGSLLTLGYLLVMQRKVFFGKLKLGLEDLREVEFGFSFVSVVLALIIIFVGVFFPLVFNAWFEPIKRIVLS